MRIIVVTNRKGGVGKTVISSHLASGLSLAGYRTALVDTDPQGHAALAFGMKKENGLYRVMCDEDTELKDVIRQIDPVRYSPPGQPASVPLYLLPSSKSTVSIPNENGSPFAFAQMLDALGTMKALDWIIIDTGPTASMFDGSVYFAATDFLYVTEMAGLSFDGLRESMKDMKALNEQNRQYRGWDTNILGVVPNKVRFQTRSQREKFADLSKHKDYQGKLWEPITLATNWEESINHGQMVYSMLPDGPEAARAYRLVNRVLEGVGAYG